MSCVRGGWRRENTFIDHYYLERWSSSYNAISEDKQFYVLSNAIKSASLLLYTPFAVRTLWNIAVHHHWDNVVIHNQGILYAIPDIVSLLVVKRMALTTTIHHVVVAVFAVCSLFNDYTQPSLCRGMVVYAVFSVFSYLVNALLASRFVDVPTRDLVQWAGVVYAGCCVLNWTWQCPLVATGPWSWYVVPYVALTLCLVYDDLILMRWLWKERSRA